MDFQTGTLVEFRNRPWVVQQSGDQDLIRLKPLGGLDAQTIALYRPLYRNGPELRSYHFQPPSKEDIGTRSYPQETRLLYDACRLGFRDIGGPFRCLGRLSFEPRPYQLVPLILALRQERVRLMIADDVGIGKTLESLLIVKELLDRQEISRFAVVCLPHLCEQWQNEIKDKFGLDAEIIRSSTVGRLTRRLRADQNLFREIPFQVISIDYIKQEKNRKVFLDHCPEFVIVDEAHTCARPDSANQQQQQRYALLHELLKQRPDQQLILLTATPHSGKQGEFQSLIGLLDPKFESFTLETPAEREALSRAFIQRRRADIRPYLGEGEAVFPERQGLDGDVYAYQKVYEELLADLTEYVKTGIRKAEGQQTHKRHTIYWDLLALMRGVMSSPGAGIGMLQNKLAKKQQDATAAAEPPADNNPDPYAFNDPLKDLPDADDNIPEPLEAASGGEEIAMFKSFIRTLEQIRDGDADEKVKKARDLVMLILSERKNPIVFCQYINTAEYVGDYLKKALSRENKFKKTEIDVITSRLSDEERKQKIDELAKSDSHVLVCTDCLSEGINLQQGFDAVIHYDLPWNPNRMEQRNGRVDRFGQTSPQVLISTLHAENNPVDDIVLNVLYKKQEEIRKKLGVYLPITDDDSSAMESIMKRILSSQAPARPGRKAIQLELFDDDRRWLQEEERKRDARYHRVEQSEKLSRTYFAHNRQETDPTQLRAAMQSAKDLIGGVEETRRFVLKMLAHYHAAVTPEGGGVYAFSLSGADDVVRPYFQADADRKGCVRISFDSPTPKRCRYIGRNHVFVEDMCRRMLNDTLKRAEGAAGRAMVMETAAVRTRTTILLMRVRSVISEVRARNRRLVGEEMIFLGYRGAIEQHDFLPPEEAKTLFLTAEPSGNIDLGEQRRLFQTATAWIHDEQTLRNHTDGIAIDRARALVDAFSQYRSVLRSVAYQVVEPVLPMDVIAAFVFVPPVS